MGEFGGGSSVFSVGDMVRRILPRYQLLSPLLVNSGGEVVRNFDWGPSFCNVYYKHNVLQIVAGAFPDTSN